MSQINLKPPHVEGHRLRKWMEVISTAVFGLQAFSEDERATGKIWIDGNPICRKVIDFGALPNTTLKTVAHSIASVSDFISMSGFCYSSTFGAWLPIPFTDDGGTQNVELFLDSTDVSITTGFNAASYDGYITLEYTKA